MFLFKIFRFQSNWIEFLFIENKNTARNSHIFLAGQTTCRRSLSLRLQNSLPMLPFMQKDFIYYRFIPHMGAKNAFNEITHRAHHFQNYE